MRKIVGVFVLAATVAAGDPITLENWQTQPFSHSSFLDVSKVVKTASVKRGSGPAYRLEERPRELIGLRFLHPDGNTKTIGAMLHDTNTNAFLVLRKGMIACELYFGDMTPETAHLSQSAGKSFVGTLFGIFVKRGLVKFDEKIVTYLPEMADTAYRDTTVKQVLDMTAGVQYSEDYLDPKSEVWRHEVSHAWKPNPGGMPATLHTFLPTLKERKTYDGEVWHYCSANTDVLAWILERVAKKPLAQIMSEEIWQPLGAEHDAYFTVDSEGTACANGGFGYTLRDGARFGQMMLQHGRYNGRQIVPAGWVYLSRTPTEETRKAWAAEENKAGKVFPKGGYSNQWWLWDIESPGRDSQPAMVAVGSFGQRLFIDFANDIVIVKFSTQAKNATPDIALEEKAAFEMLAKKLGDGGGGGHQKRDGSHSTPPRPRRSRYASGEIR